MEASNYCLDLSMSTFFIKWNRPLLLALIISIIFIAYSFSKKDEFCSVIDDLRKVDAVRVVNTFDDSKIAYYVDLQNSYQILVVKGQVEKAYSVLSTIGIKNKSELQNGCKKIR